VTADLVREILRWTDVGIFSYFVALNSSYLVLIVMAGLEFARHLRRAPFAGADDMFRSPLTLPVSVIVPAHNEGAGIVAAVTGETPSPPSTCSCPSWPNGACTASPSRRRCPKRRPPPLRQCGRRCKVVRSRSPKVVRAGRATDCSG